MSLNPFPFNRAGRQTLVYLSLAGSGPVLTAATIWALGIIRDFPGADAAARLRAFASIADKVAWSLFVVVVALACFVSIRAVKLGKGGFEAEANDNGDDGPPVAGTLTISAQATATPAVDGTPSTN